MCKNQLHEKAKKSFYLILGIGGFLIALFLFSGVGTIVSVISYSHPLLGKIEETCGCSAAIVSATMNTPTTILLLILGSISLLFFIYIIIKTISLYKRTKKFIDEILIFKKDISSPIIRGLADTLDLNDHIIELESDKAIVFTFGYWNRKICISSKIVEELEIDELRAILEHEQEHLKSFDPLKIFITKLFSEIFYFVPEMNTLSDQFEMLSELSADEGVTNCFETKKHLASALYKILGLKHDEVRQQNLAISLFSLKSTMGERIHVLFDPTHSPYFKFITKRLMGFIILSISVFSVFMVNLPESNAHILEEGTTHCINHVSESNNACKLVHEELCERDYSSVHNELCNKTF